LLGRDEADDVGVQALRREVLFDVGDEAVLVLLERGDVFDGLFDGGHQATSFRRAAWRAWASSQASAKRFQSSCVVSQPPLTRMAQAARSPCPMADSTGEAFTLPEEQAAPALTMTP